MQSVCKVRSRLEGFLGRFFLVQLVFWLQALNAMTAPAAQDITRLHEASLGLMAAQDITRLHWASWRRRASRRLSRPHEASRRLMAAQDITRLHGGTDSGSKGDFGYSFGSRFGSKIFFEQLCFSINSSILPLLLPMLPKNPQKVSRIGDSCKSVCIGGLD